MKSESNKQGGALVMVMVILVALSILSVGLFKLAEYDAVETVRETLSTQAFWVAESGLQQTLERILTDKNYRGLVSNREEYADDPDGVGTYQIDIDGAGKTGSYDLAVWRDGTKDYYIEVQATVNNMKRRLFLAAKNVRPDLSYAIMVVNGDARIKKNAEINGSLYTWGELWLLQDVSVLGSIFAKEFKGSDDYDVTGLAEEMEFEFDSEYYQNELNDAASGKKKALKSSTLNLNNGTTYVNGNVAISKEITGPGTLVVNGNINFSGNYSIDDDVQIILSGNFSAGKEGTLGTNVNIFAKGNGTFGKATMNGDGASSMIFAGNFNANKEIEYSGLIYAGGNVNFKKTSVIDGSIIAGGNFDIDKDSVITYDQDMIPAWILDGNMFIVERFTSDNTWNELPPD